MRKWPRRQFGIEGTIWLAAEAAAGQVMYDADKHRATIGRVSVAVFDRVEVQPTNTSGTQP
jgi:hypothetical protein